ncbi:T9SS type A sorting domain-containing protein [Crocinitomix catalasitica]|uniref:T9SS type A sorting domain-containing protein n=1 Tax=Crocinitomix catalasitica TaxID=184607 RepID=UPI000685A75B|nr:T9SS type A sorting domain-containing protein [Crocinitomix catalasitica]
MIKNYLKQIFIFGGFMIAGFSASSQITTFDYSGTIDTYTVPAGVTVINIEARGAQGANDGGLGAIMIGDIEVTPGEVLNILVGSEGLGDAGRSGGGGGSFVVNSASEPLIIAGGGGGRAWDGVAIVTTPGIDANTGEAGNDGYSEENGLDGAYLTQFGYGGLDGNGATLPGPGGLPHAGNGGGFYTNGANGECGNGGFSYLSGGAGGGGCGVGIGGFGGGGAGGNQGGGGGGGYSGGGGSYHSPANGGGAGSFNSGLDQENSVGNTGNGQIIISTCDALTVTVSAETVCFGTSFTLDASGTGSITWDNGVVNGTAFTPTDLGITTYTATSDNAGDCAFSIDINVLDAPAIYYSLVHEVTGGDGEINLSVLGGAPAYTYDWNIDGTGDFDDAEDLTGLTGGTYVVTVKDQNECTSTSSIVINKFASVVNNDELTLSVYPNPTSDELTIETEGNFSYQIIGMDGAAIINGAGNDMERISLNEIANGVYFVKVNAANKQNILKIVKK